MDLGKTTKELAEILHRADSADDLKKMFAGDDFFAHLSFSEYFNGLEKVRKISRADLIRDALIDRTYGYQILNGLRHPSRDKVIALGISASLDEIEMHRALLCSGYSDLYARKKRDAVIIYALRKGMNVQMTNDLLSDFQEAVLQ